MSLRRQVLKGVSWATASQILRQVVQIITLLILANLLSPGDFGLISVANVVIGFLSIFNNLGIGAALVQRKTLTNNLISSVFWANLLLSTCIAVVVVFSAPWIASFYNEPRVEPVLRVLAIGFILSGASIVQKALCERDLLFARLAKIEILAVLCGAGSGIIAAYSGAGVWSLVLQSLTIICITTLLLWFFSQWKPHFLLHFSEVRSLSRFSLNLTAFEIFNYFSRNADYILIGRFLGLEALGYYTLAYRIMLYPLQNVSSVMVRVMLPVFARFQEDDARLRGLYIRVSSAIALVTFPVMFGIGAIIQPLVMLLGPEWQPIVPLVWILIPVGVGQSVTMIVGVIYQVKGRTDWLFLWGIFAGIFFVTAFLIGLRNGIIGVAVAYALAYFLIVYPALAIPFRLVDLKVGLLLRELWQTALCSIIMLVSILLIADLLLELQPILLLALLIISGVVVYGVATLIFNRHNMRQILKLVQSG